MPEWKQIALSREQVFQLIENKSYANITSSFANTTKHYTLNIMLFKTIVQYSGYLFLYIQNRILPLLHIILIGVFITCLAK